MKINDGEASYLQPAGNSTYEGKFHIYGKYRLDHRRLV